MAEQKRKVKRLSFLPTIICSGLGLVLIAAFIVTSSVKPAAGAPVRITWGNAWSEFYNPLFEEVGKRIEQRTNNAIKFDYFWGGSLVKAMEERKLVIAGAVDMTHIQPVYYPDLVMANWTWAMPFNPIDNATMVKLIYDVFATFPQIQKEIGAYPVHIIGQWASPPYDFNGKFPLTKISDLKGKKIIGLGKYEPQWYHVAGATAVTVPAPERFTALQTGMVDGGTGQVPFFLSYKFYDAGSPYITYLGIGARTGNGYIVMNKKKWDSLPPNVQKVIHEEWDRYAFETAPATVGKMVVEWRAQAEKVGFKINMLPDDQKKEWARLIEPIIQQYARDIDKDKNEPGLGTKFIKYIQSKAKQLGAPIFHEFKLD